jgi:putative Mg2+ transporter-C (MgtC) family protein
MQLSAAEALLRVGLAVLLGMAIGLEREWREKAAGFRTITLVTVGSALFVTITYSGFSPADRARVAAGVVTGIGFLGAGAILRERGQVIGLTTAATVWAACMRVMAPAQAP